MREGETSQIEMATTCTHTRDLWVQLGMPNPFLLVNLDFSSPTSGTANRSCSASICGEVGPEAWQTGTLDAFLCVAS